MAKLVYVVLDGVADRQYSDLKGSPLEAADTPNMDMLAKRGSTGEMTVIREDIAPESDQATFALLGFDPFTRYTGRGVLEALGADIEFDSEHIILRANFAVEDENKVVQHIQAPITEDEAKEYAQLLTTHVDVPHADVEVIPTVGYRAVVLLKPGRPVEGRISNTHPGYRYVENYVTTANPIKGEQVKRKPCTAVDHNDRAKLAAEIVDSFVNKASQTLKKHGCKANTILTRGASFDLPGLGPVDGAWAMLADMPVEKAIGEMCGMDVLEKGGSLNAAKTIVDHLDEYDAFYVQIKSPDKASHKGSVDEKVTAIEEIDKNFFNTLLEDAHEDLIICVTADHASECAVRAHTNRRVPVLLWGKGVEKDDSNVFSEIAGKTGALGYFETGQELFIRLMEMYRDAAS